MTKKRGELTLEQLDKARAYCRAYYRANREKCLAQTKAWRLANPEKDAASNKAYRLANPEKVAAWGKAWAIANREHLKAVRKAYQQAHPEVGRKASMKWQLSHPEKTAINNRTRKLKENGFTRELYDRLLNEQGGACAICGVALKIGQGMTCAAADHDHVTEKHRGILCQRCNFGIWYFNDNVELLLAAADYLKNYEDPEEKGRAQCRLME